MKKKILPIEWATLAYLLLTLIVLLLWREDMGADTVQRLLVERIEVFLGLVACYVLYRYRPSRATEFLRHLYPLILTAYWYPDTYEFCSLLPNQDPAFAAADQWLCGCQPALTFSEHYHDVITSELMHLGYFVYYPLIFVAVLFPFFTNHRLFQRTAFTVLAAFLIYYVVYLFLPVTGPQYYFVAVGEETIRQGVFPEVGDWFRTHTELLPMDLPEGLFRTLVEMMHQAGERPTAAFPSSHVGVSTVMMMCLWKNRPYRFMTWAMLPFYLLLCVSTVYIQAHYLVDALAGLITGLILFILCWYGYAWLTARATSQDDINTTL